MGGDRGSPMIRGYWGKRLLARWEAGLGGGGICMAALAISVPCTRVLGGRQKWWEHTKRRHTTRSEAGVVLRAKIQWTKVMRTPLFSTLHGKFATTGCSGTRKLKYHELLLLVFLLMLKFLQNLYTNSRKLKERRKEEFDLRELGCYTLVITPCSQVMLLITNCYRVQSYWLTPAPVPRNLI